jgi:hypothetical protein
MDNVVVDFLSAIQRLPSAVSGHVRQPSDLAEFSCRSPGHRGRGPLTRPDWLRWHGRVSSGRAGYDEPHFRVGFKRKPTLRLASRRQGH